MVPVKDYLVLAHGNCPDGFSAAWAAWLKLGDQADYQFVNYGDPVPDVRGRLAVYVLDFSWPRAEMTALANNASMLVVLDHHKTALEALQDIVVRNGKIVFDLNRSGATLAWDWFFGDGMQKGVHPTISRELVEYVEDRDLWRWKLPDSREISVAMWSYPKAFIQWTLLANLGMSLLVPEGRAILRYQQQLVEQMARNTTWRDIGGYHVPVVNASVCFSEVGEYLCIQNPNAPFAAYYFDRADHKRQWGSRSRGGFDVSEVAKQFGGGGHPGAAGWMEAVP